MINIRRGIKPRCTWVDLENVVHSKFCFDRVLQNIDNRRGQHMYQLKNN